MQLQRSGSCRVYDSKQFSGLLEQQASLPNPYM
jgi:hypothetical protein